MTEQDLVFRTRALAQAHPLSSVGHRYMRWIVDRERGTQVHPDMGEWAGHALTTGYCLRKVEEVDVKGAHPVSAEITELETADDSATDVATTLRTTGLGDLALFPEAVLVDTLDRLILGEIDRRLDQWRDTTPPEVWRQLEDYLAWWVIKGYAFRVVETRS